MLKKSTMVIISAIIFAVVFFMDFSMYFFYQQTGVYPSMTITVSEAMYRAFNSTWPHMTLLWVNIILLVIQCMFTKPATTRTIVCLKLFINGIVFWGLLFLEIFGSHYYDAWQGIVSIVMLLAASVLSVIFGLMEFRALPPKEEPAPEVATPNPNPNPVPPPYYGGAPRQPYGAPVNAPRPMAGRGVPPSPRRRPTPPTATPVNTPIQEKIEETTEE